MQPLRTAVVIPYCSEPDAWIRRAIDSVLAQTHAATAFVVADGAGLDWIDDLPVRHIVLGRAHADYGNTPRGIGAMLALREGFEAIAYLDADNLYAADHLQGLHDALRQHGADVVTCARHFLRPDGSRLRPAPPDEDFRQHTDTNCYLLTGRALPLATLWLQMPGEVALIGDRVFRAVLMARGLRIAHLPRASVGYTTLWRAHYDAIGEPAPPGAKRLDITPVRAWWQGIDTAQRSAFGVALGVPGFELVLAG
jgi:hypothetical protein